LEFDRLLNRHGRLKGNLHTGEGYAAQATTRTRAAG